MIRAISAAALAAILVAALPSGALAQMGGGKGGPGSARGLPAPSASCTIQNVNPIAFTFTCGGEVYQAYGTTVFELGSAGKTFYDLSVGMTVVVTSHSSASGLVADTVTAS